MPSETGNRPFVSFGAVVTQRGSLARSYCLPATREPTARVTSASTGFLEGRTLSSLVSFAGGDLPLPTSVDVCARWSLCTRRSSFVTVHLSCGSLGVRWTLGTCVLSRCALLYGALPASTPSRQKPGERPIRPIKTGLISSAAPAAFCSHIVPCPIARRLDSAPTMLPQGAARSLIAFLASGICPSRLERISSSPAI